MERLEKSINAGFDLAEQLFVRQSVWLIAIVALFAFQLTLIWTHKPWADELQALMIALEAPSQTVLLDWLRYEGHPPLWYWLLQASSLLVEPEAVLPLAATLCAIVTQSIILFGSPFQRIERLLIASSQFVLFEFLTISRGASLGVALLVLALFLWRSRWFWLVLAALPLVDFLYGVLSGILLVLKWREKQLWWPGIGVWLAGSVIAAWSVLPPADVVPANQVVNAPMRPFLWFRQASGLLIPWQGGFVPGWNKPLYPFAGFVWIGFLVLCWVSVKHRIWHLLCLFGFLGLTFAFGLAIYPLSLRHLMLGAFLLIMLVWLGRTYGDAPQWPFRAWIAVAAISGIASSSLSAIKGFDSADQALAEIEARGLKDKHWIAMPEWRAPSIAGRSSMEFSRPEEDCLFRFVRWDHKSPALTDSDSYAAALKEELAQHGKAYLLSDLKLKGFDPMLVKRIVSVPEGYNGIGYHLYVVGPQEAEKSVELPFCYED